MGWIRVQIGQGVEPERRKREIRFGLWGNLSGATKILKRMEEIDVEGSVSFFKSRCGYCDCEIMFNIVALLDEQGGELQ